jgi:hypothetical protein
MDSDAERMSELMKPIEQQILMCDTREDLVMLACAMMITIKDIFDLEIGEEKRKEMFKELT